jgi:ankyrin repeat protein
MRLRLKTFTWGLVSLGILTSALAGCSSNQRVRWHSQELIQASRKGDAQKVEKLIQAGADINATDSAGWTPYLAASTEGNWDVMRILENHGCKKDPGF